MHFQGEGQEELRNDGKVSGKDWTASTFETSTLCQMLCSGLPMHFLKAAGVTPIFQAREQRFAEST